MKILSIELINWRAYSEARFEFNPSGKSDIVVIGAPNGHGKTSFFEAVTLCLYGKAGLPLLARASDQKMGRPGVSYDNFLREVLHTDAVKTSRKITVNISFRKENGDKLFVERRWFFSPAGLHYAGDEEFIVGLNGRYLMPDEGQTDEDWQDDVISEHFIPHSLARFFLFDGEMVRDWAKMDMATQVKQGIEGLMGIPILRELIGDLASYANKKRGEVRTPKSAENVKALSEEIEELKGEKNGFEREIEGFTDEIRSFKTERERLQGELHSLGMSGSQRLAELYQMQSDLRTQLSSLQDNIQSQIVSDFALGLAGKDIIQKASEFLESDKILQDWTASKRQGDKGYKNFLDSVSVALESEEYGIPDQYHATIISLVENTWGTIWYPKPEGMTNEAYFPELTGTVRDVISLKLKSIMRDAASGISKKFSDLDQLQRTHDSNDREIRNHESIGPRYDEIANELRTITDNLEELYTEKGSKETHLKGLGADIDNKTATLGQLTNLNDASQPIIKLAEKAESVSKIVNNLIAEIVPVQSKGLAKNMTKIYTCLSNKSVVKKVEIDPDFSVHLLNSTGKDIREIAMSAGEEQIFSQALISSVVEVSDFDFPMIVDTPLARLDDTHRKSILEYFKGSGRQIIFLSTDTEIVGEYLDILNDKISDTYLINHNNKDGVGYSTASRGYFE